VPIRNLPPDESRLSEREHCEVYRAWLVAELVDVDTVLAGLMADGTPFARPVGVEAVAQSRKQQEAAR